MAENAGSRKIRWYVCFALPLLFGAGGQLWAATNTVTGGIDSRTSDNARKDPANEVSDTETRVNLSFLHQSDPGQCSSSADISLGYGYWHQDSFDEEIYTNGNAQGQCELAKGLVWQVADSISQVTRNSRQANTPDNRTRKNIFTTGPVYTLALTQVDQVRFAASYENTEYEESEEADGEKVSASVGYNRALTASWSAGLSARAERTELDTQEELDRESITVNTRKIWATTELAASLGYNQLETRQRNIKAESDGITGSLSLIRELNPTSDLSINISRQLTDQTSTLGVQFEDFNFNLQDSSGVEVTAINMAYDKRFAGGASFNVAASGDRSDYQASGNREQTGAVSIRASRPLTARVTVAGDATYQYVRYEVDGVDEQNTSVSLNLSYRVTPTMDLRSSIGHERKVSDDFASEYRENWIALGLNYRFL